MSISENSQNNFSSLKNKQIIFPNYLDSNYLISFALVFFIDMVFFLFEIYYSFNATLGAYSIFLLFVSFELIALNKPFLLKILKFKFLFYSLCFLLFLFYLSLGFLIIHLKYNILKLELNDIKSELFIGLILSFMALFLLPTLKFALEKIGFSFKESGYGD
jgi:hypothetical protein